MDLTNILTYIWNIIVILSLQIPGTIFNTIEYNNSTRLKGIHLLHPNVINTMEPVHKASLSSSAVTSMPDTSKTTALASSAATPLATTATTPLTAITLSSSKRESVNGSAIEYHPTTQHYMMQERTTTIGKDASLTGSMTGVTIAQIPTETLVNNDSGNNDPDARAALLHVLTSKSTVHKNASTSTPTSPSPQMSTSVSQLQESPALDLKGTSSALKPLVQSTRDYQGLDCTLIKMRMTAVKSNSNSNNNHLPRSAASTDTIINIADMYLSRFTPVSKDTTTASAINTLDMGNRTTFHKSVNQIALPDISHTSVVSAVKDKTTLSTKRVGRAKVLPLSVIKSTSIVDINLKQMTAALVQDAGSSMQTQYYFKNNNSSATAVASDKTSPSEVAKSPANEAATSLSLSLTTTATSPSASSQAMASLASSTTQTSLVTAEPATTTSSSAKKTTRRRPVATTTLKPPPTIDDYQTVTSQAGTHAYLPCNVKQLVKKPISWLRVRDGHILTVDQTTFIADQRFQSIFTVKPERWSLQIKYVQLRDAGIYECQVSTEPKASAIVYLHVVEPKTELIGAPTRHVKAGSQVKLLCIISQALEPPIFINWFYNQKQIYLNNRKGWRTEIERIELPPDTTTTTTTTTTTSTTTTTTTTPATTSSSSSAPPTASTESDTDGQPLTKGSEVHTTHVFTSLTTQSLNDDDNLVDLMSEPTRHPNLIQPEAVPSRLTTSKTQTSPTSTSTSAAAAAATTSLPSVSPSTKADNIKSTSATTQSDDDYTSEPTITVGATPTSMAESMASARERGYMMLSTLMTVADVKQITAASLIIPSVQKQDSGNYTCSPSNSEPRTVILHVLNGEYSASAITSDATNVKYQLNVFIIKIFALCFMHYSMTGCSVYIKSHVIRRYNGG